MPINKIGNGYAAALDEAGNLFTATPKAVLGAMVVSLMTCGGDTIDDLDALRAAFITEWEALHGSNIVRQKPPRVKS